MIATFGRWVLVGVTGAAAFSTIRLVATGTRHDVGLVVFGAAVSVLGIIILAVPVRAGDDDG